MGVLLLVSPLTSTGVIPTCPLFRSNSLAIRLTPPESGGSSGTIAVKLSIDETEDVTQEGLLGLVEAAGRFREDRLPRALFWGYARHRVRKRIGKAIRAIRRQRLPDPDQRRRANFCPAGIPCSGGGPVARRDRHCSSGCRRSRRGSCASDSGSTESVAHAVEISRDCALSPRRVDQAMRAGLDRLLNIIASSYDRDVKTRKLFPRQHDERAGPWVVLVPTFSPCCHVSTRGSGTIVTGYRSRRSPTGKTSPSAASAAGLLARRGLSPPLGRECHARTNPGALPDAAVPHCAVLAPVRVPASRAISGWLRPCLHGLSCLRA